MESKNIIPIVLANRKYLHLPYDTSLQIFQLNEEKWEPCEGIAAQFLRLATALYKCGELENKDDTYFLLDGFSNSGTMMDPSTLLNLDLYETYEFNHVHFIERNRPEKYGFTVAKAIYGTATMFTDITEILQSRESNGNVLYIPKGSRFFQYL